MPTAPEGLALTSMGAHPDSRRLAAVREALDWWECQPSVAGVTSSVTGLGAVTVAEQRLSKLHGDKPVLLLPNATYAILLALRLLEVGPGDEVLVPAVDWPASTAVVTMLHATPVPVQLDARTSTMDAVAAHQAVTSRTKAAVVSHLGGYAADLSNVVASLDGIPVIEDAAAVLGQPHSGHLAGTMGEFGVLSFGPGKAVDAGEGGALICPDDRTWRSAIALSAHPVRQGLEGLIPDAAQPGMRPHPIMAIQVAHALRDGLPEYGGGCALP